MGLDTKTDCPTDFGRDMTSTSMLAKKKNTSGHDPQEGRCQDELLGSKQDSEVSQSEVELEIRLELHCWQLHPSND
jgi:hypothetical protein